MFRNDGDVGVYTILLLLSLSLSPSRQTFLHLHLWYNWNAKGSCSRAQSVSLNHGLHIMGGKLDMAPPLSKV